MCGNPADSFGGLCDRCLALQTLGLEGESSSELIENTYRMLVKVWHPDRFASDPKLRLAAEEKLKEINAAHDYLVLEPAAKAPNPAKPAPESEGPPAAPSESYQTDQPSEPPDDVPRDRYRGPSVLKMFLKLGLALGVLAVAALLWFSLDGFLSAEPRTARVWDEYKIELKRDVEANGKRLWANVTGSLARSKPENPQPVIAVETIAPPLGPPQPVAKRESAARVRPQGSAIEVHGIAPLITAGLTPMEVISILGSPTSSSGEKMFYKGSEIDFRNGQVVGWNIGAGTAPIRVKLWPETPLVAGVTMFAVGSSKSDVIALQGTPNLFSDNEFGYGSSVVFFKNDRVVGWKVDPASVRLRAVAQ